MPRANINSIIFYCIAPESEVQLILIDNLLFILRVGYVIVTILSHAFGQLKVSNEEMNRVEHV